MSDKQQYWQPVAPTDLDAEYMTVQETAYVLKCSVKTVRRLLDELEIKVRVGRSIVTNRATRAALYEHRAVAPKTAHKAAHRRRVRKTVARKPATPRVDTVSAAA